MQLDIDDDQLKALLEEKKNHIGHSWKQAIMDCGSGVALLITSASADFSSKMSVQYDVVFHIILYPFSLFLVFLGVHRLILSLRSRDYNSKQLYNDILSLNKSKRHYSLVAIKNTYDKYPNKYLMYYDKKWKVYFFPKFKRNGTDTTNSIRNQLSAYLKIDEQFISVEFLTEEPNQKKFSEDGKIYKVYDHRYYKATINSFRESMKKDRFIIEGINFRWMTFQEMEGNANVRKKNSDVIQIFKTYLYNH